MQPSEFWLEEADYYPEIIGVGTLISDHGPLEEPRRLPWQKKEPEVTKPTFGFSRVLDEV